MRRLLISVLFLACAPAKAQIECGNADGINCGFEPGYGWIVNGSAPRREKRPRLPELPSPEPYVVSAEEIKRLFHEVPIPADAIASALKMMDRHRAVLAQWEVRQGLPSENPALYTEIVKLKRETDATISYRMGFTKPFPERIRAWSLTIAYVAAVAAWEQGVEASFDGTDPKEAKQFLINSVAYLSEAGGGLLGVPTTNATLAAREFGAFWVRADEAKQLQLAAGSQESGIYLTGGWADARWIKAVNTHAAQQQPVYYDLLGTAKRIEQLVKAKAKAKTTPSKAAVPAKK